MKTKFLRSKGGWIGALILTGILFYIFNKNMSIGNILGTLLNPLWIPLDFLFYLLPPLMFVVTFIWGFILGYFIEKTFFRKRRKR